jgi:hypothetical protein
MLAKAAHFTVYVNRDYLADLHNANYASIEVPPGTVSLSIPSVHLGSTPMNEPALATAGTDCEGIQWHRLGSAKEAQWSACREALSQGQAALQRQLAARQPTANDRPPLCGTLIPQRCYQELLYAQDLMQFAPTPVFHFEAEAGRTYYVKLEVSWSSALHGKSDVKDMFTETLVSPDVGLRETRRLKRAHD